MIRKSIVHLGTVFPVFASFFFNNCNSSLVKILIKQIFSQNYLFGVRELVVHCKNIFFKFLLVYFLLISRMFFYQISIYWWTVSISFKYFRAYFYRSTLIFHSTRKTSADEIIYLLLTFCHLEKCKLTFFNIISILFRFF